MDFSATTGPIPRSLASPDTPPLAGSSEDIAAGLRAYAREGIDHLQLYLWPLTLAGLERFAPTLALLDQG